MARDHAKKEMETGKKPTTSHWSTSSEESSTKRKEKKKLTRSEGPFERGKGLKETRSL